MFLLIHPEGRGGDALGFWSFDPRAPYVNATGNLGAPVAFRYGPPIALLLEPLQALPWSTFLWLMTSLTLVALAWLCRSWALATLAFYPVLLEVSYANVNVVLAAALVLGLRRPAAWSLLFLTKVTPGLAIVWFLARRDWRAVGEIAVVTGIVSAISWLIAPDLWPQWLAMLASDVAAPNDGNLRVPLLLRLPAAALLLFWGARTNRRWCLAVALLLTTPVIWDASFSVLVALSSLQRKREAE